MEHREGQASSTPTGSSVEVEADKTKNTNAAESAANMKAVISGLTPTAHANKPPEERSGESSRNHGREPAASKSSSPPGTTLPSRRKSFHRQTKQSATVAGGQNAAKKQRSKRRLSLQWRQGPTKAAPPTAMPKILAVDCESKDIENGTKLGGDDGGHVGSVDRSGDTPGAANVVDAGKIGGETSSSSSSSSARFTSVGNCQPGGRGVAAAVYAELDQLGAAARVPFLLNASCPLHQELGVTFLATGLQGSAEKNHHETR